MRTLFFYIGLIVSLFSCTSSRLVTSADKIQQYFLGEEYGKFGLYKIGEGWVVNPVYKNGYDVSIPYNGLIRIKDSIGTGFCFYDNSLKKKFCVPYPNVQNYYDTYAYFATDSSDGLINLTGLKVFETKLSSEEGVSDIIIQNRYVFYAKGGHFYVYDLVENEDIYKTNEEVDNFELVSESLAIVTKGDLVKVIDFKLNKMIVPPDYFSIKDMSNLTKFPFVHDRSDFVFKAEGIQGISLFDKSGERLTAHPLEELRYFINDKTVFKANGKYGVISIDGEIVISAEYDDFQDFNVGQHGVYAFFKNGKAGVVNSDNEILIPFSYNDIRVVDSQKFLFKERGLWGIIDKAGTIILPATYDELFIYPHSDYIIALKDGVQGVLDKDGNIVAPFLFESIAFF